MKKGINIWTFPWPYTIEGCIEKAADIGYDAIELSLNEQGMMSLESTDEELERYRLKAEEVGIEISSLSCGLYWMYSMSSDDPAERQKALDIAKTQIRFAKLLGASAVLLVPGSVYVPFVPDFKVVPYDVVYERALHAMKELAPYAESMGICVCIENVWNQFLLSPLETRNFIDEIASPNVKVYMDVGNVMNIGYPQHWIRILGDRVGRVHVKDYKKDVGGLNGFCELLEGDVPFPEVMQALKEMGYDHPITAEITVAPGAVERTYDALCKICSMISD